MTLAQVLVSALGMAAAAVAHPAYPAGQVLGRQVEPTTTITMTRHSTLTHQVAIATATATGTASSGNSTLGLPGVCYAPYRADHDCKTPAQIDDDFSRITGAYSFVRVYGTDCGQVPAVYAAAKARSLKLFLGIWDLGAVQAEADLIIAGIAGDWDIVHTVSVGNELVNSGQASPAAVVAAIKQARTILRAAGYLGPVVTVDTFVAAGTHPELCEASDYCAVNAHAFFDSTISAGQAGTWLANTVANLKKTVAGSKSVVVTESGWPTEGLTNGLAVPGLSQQQAALDSIKQAFAASLGDVVLFSAFNDPWKANTAATFDADQYWGIGGAVSNSDK
ncbi:hypothetical protein G7046_g2005 [Stylonectria norvegica]|nr:hypothetical protein G7046_g2005 [Stylonectria norvegica]